MMMFTLYMIDKGKYTSFISERSAPQTSPSTVTTYGSVSKISVYQSDNGGLGKEASFAFYLS